MNLSYAAEINRLPRFGGSIRPASAAWTISLAVHAIAGGVFWQHLSNVAPVPREPLMLRASIRALAPPTAPAVAGTPASALSDNAQSAARSTTRAAPRSTPVMPVSVPVRALPVQAPDLAAASVASAAATSAPVEATTATLSSVASVGATQSSATAVAAARTEPAAPLTSHASTHQHVGGHVEVKYLHTPKPDYPAAARRRGLEGTVLLRVLVNPDGIPGETRLIGPSGTDALDQAALAAVLRWRFTPAREANVAIAHWVDIPITFRLNGNQ